MQPAVATLPLPTSPFTFPANRRSEPGRWVFFDPKGRQAPRGYGFGQDRLAANATRASSRPGITLTIPKRQRLTASGPIKPPTANCGFSFLSFHTTTHFRATWSTKRRLESTATERTRAPGRRRFRSLAFLFADSAIANIGPAQFDQFRTGTVYQFLDTLSLVHGNHSFKAGLDIRLNRRSAESRAADDISICFDSRFSKQRPVHRFRPAATRYSIMRTKISGFLFRMTGRSIPRLSLNLGLALRRKHGQPREGRVSCRTSI